MYKKSTILKLSIIALNTILMSNLMHNDLVTINRPEDTYLVSKLLDKQKLLFKRSDQYLWNQLEGGNPLIGLKSIEMDKLLQYEQLTRKIVNESINERFEGYKKVQYFTSIEQIEQKIKAELKIDFSFNSLWNLWKPLEKLKIKQEIINFYNFIINSNVLNIDNLLRLVASITTQDVININGQKLEEWGAYTKMTPNIQCMTFKTNWYNKLTNNRLYNSGFYTTNDPFHSFVHEYGHAISNFWSLFSNEKKTFNTGIINKKYNSCEEVAIENKDLIQRDSDVQPIMEKMFDSLYNKFEVNNASERNINFLKFAKWTAVPSQYGRVQTLSKINGISQLVDYEWFAEAFAYWYLTPVNERNILWGWLNEIFTIEIPQFFNN